MKNVFLFDQPIRISVGVEGAMHDVIARPLYHTRVYVIEKAPSNPVLVGQLTMPRWPILAEQRALKNKQRLSFRSVDVTYPVFEDLYELHRALSHVLDRYEMNEVPRLTTALVHCHALHRVCLGLQKDNFLELIGHIESLVDQVVGAIGLQVKNDAKHSALERIIVVRKGVDSLNRVNSSATCLRMLSAVGNLIHRESSIVDIAEIYAGRRQAVRLTLATLETQVLIVEDFLNETLRYWGVVCQRRRELTVYQLDQFVRALESISVKPFSITFEYVVDEFKEASRHIASNRMDQAKAYLVTSAASLQLRRLRMQLEAVHYRIASLVHDANLRKQHPHIVQEAHNELRHLVEELSAINTLGMVDFSSTSVLASFAAVQAALAAGNCKEAADHFRLALRSI